MLKRNRLTGWSILLTVLCCTVPALAAKSVLRLHFDGPLPEAPPDEGNIMSVLQGEKPNTLHETLTKIQKAGRDKDIAGIVMIIENPEIGLAQLEELHHAVREFRKTGKKVFAYMDYGTNRSYALATAADHIMIADNSELEITGLNAQLSFYKGLFDKIGVEPDMIHCGDYKTALEPFVRKEPSKENTEMMNWLLDGLYAGLVKVEADGRGLKIEEIKAAIDSAPIIGADMLQRKLVDSIGSYNEFQQLIKKEFGSDVEIVKKYPRKEAFDLDMSNPFAMFQKFQELFAPEEEEKGAGVGLIFLEGGINTGKSGASPLGGSGVGSSTIRHALETAMADDNIKAVVLRVNSPGGSALASDIMWKAATRLGKTKPLIVSMGNVAGSGGYYVSIPADTIFAEPTTLTGSIGVVGGKLVWKQLWEEYIGITTTEISRGKNAGLMSMNRPWTEEERAHVTKLMNDIYAQFKDRVMSSRGPRIKGDLEPLAGGRVYTGQQALERGLIDRLGGLSDAIAFAAEKASLKSNPDIYVLPRKPEPLEVLMRLFGEETPDEWDFPGGGGEKATTSMSRGSNAAFGAFATLFGGTSSTDGGAKAAAGAANAAAAAFANLSALNGGSQNAMAALLRAVIGVKAPEALRAKLGGLNDMITIHREGVGCVMPFYLDIR